MEHDRLAYLCRVALFLEREAHFEGKNIEAEITKVIAKLKQPTKEKL